MGVQRSPTLTNRVQVAQERLERPLAGAYAVVIERYVQEGRGASGQENRLYRLVIWSE